MDEKPRIIGGRVAVIAIHGVGDHLPEAMAKAACGLLETRQTAAGVSRYEAFRENLVRIKIGASRQNRPILRPCGPHGASTQVDVYDMFWSDLSGVGASGLRILAQRS